MKKLYEMTDEELYSELEKYAVKMYGDGQVLTRANGMIVFQAKSKTITLDYFDMVHTNH